ncbi:MAG: transporter [Paenibacillus sp.]|nr:transporter [Paenibacillus sp.]
MNPVTKRWAALLLLGVLASVQAGCSYANAAEQPKPELLKPVKKEEDLYEVKVGNIAKQVRGTGVFVSASTKYYQYTAGGRLNKIHLNPGDTVKKGDVMLELMPTTLFMQIAQQKLVVAKAEDTLDESKKAGEPEKLRMAGLTLELEQLRLGQLEDTLAKTKLVADRSGVVTFLDFIKPGDSIAAYKNIVGISDPNDLLFMYSTGTAADLTSVERDMEAIVTFNGKDYKGTVVQTPRTAPITDNQQQNDRNARSLLIKVDSLPPDVQLGSQAELSVVTDTKENVIIIPRVGLRSYQGRNFVHLKEGTSRKEVDVEKGLETATEVEIRKGLKAGQQLILNN